MKQTKPLQFLLAVLIGWATLPFHPATVPAHEDCKHPSGAQLVRLKRGELTDEVIQKILQHFAECTDCAQFFAEYGEESAPVSKSASQSAWAPESGHPSDGQLALLLHGGLSDEEVAAVLAHIGACQQCTQSFAAMHSKLGETAVTDPAPAASTVPAPVAPLDIAPAPVAPAPESGHPGDGQLALLLHGGLSDEEVAAVLAHIGACQQCTQSFAAMHSKVGETVVTDATPPASTDPAPATPVDIALVVPVAPAPESGHPGDGQLALLLHGGLSDEEVAAVLAHIGACQQCTQSFAAMHSKAGETVVTDAAPAAPPASAPAAPVDIAPVVPVVPAPESGHPGDGQLALLLHGGLSDEDVAAVLAHIGACQQCTQSFAAMHSKVAETVVTDAAPAAPTNPAPAVTVDIAQSTAAAKPNCATCAAARKKPCAGACAEIGDRISKLQERVSRLIEIARQSRGTLSPQGKGRPCCNQHNEQLKKLEKKIAELEGSLQ